MTEVKLLCEKCFIFTEKRNLNTYFVVTFMLHSLGGEYMRQHNPPWVSGQSRKTWTSLVWGREGARRARVEERAGAWWERGGMSLPAPLTMEGWDEYGEWPVTFKVLFFPFFPSDSHYSMPLAGVAEVASTPVAQAKQEGDCGPVVVSDGLCLEVTTSV